MSLSEDDVKWDGPLPIVLVTDEHDEYVCIEQGDGAEARAAEWCGENVESGPFSVSIHDERCPHCNRTYWHEAPTGSEETGWHCPLCDAALTKDDGKPPEMSAEHIALAWLLWHHGRDAGVTPTAVAKSVGSWAYGRGMYESDGDQGYARQRAVDVRKWVLELFSNDARIEGVDDDDEEYLGDVVAAARRTVVTASGDRLRALFITIREALEGDSNDDEHDALADVADFFGIPWTTS